MLDHSEANGVSLESINISAGGIFFRSDRAFEIKEHLFVKFKLPQMEKAIVAECRVMHSLETIPGRQYFIGTCFEKLQGISFARLSELLDESYG